ncbi:MAG: hypothetical protein JJ896_07725 [Rhodothermales bacterium]|nr:hypothetical protein [Rhodothermales bacterium]MBO6779528.1 hypothetical protein [Rhodothermales bacterium]
MRFIRLLAAAVLLAAMLPASGNAQPRPELSTVTVAAVPVAFALDHENPAIAFDFSETVVGLYITRPGLQIALHNGSPFNDDGALDLFDLNLSVFGRLLADRTEDWPVFVPVMLHSSYRRVRRIESGSQFAAFEYTGVGLGAGLAGRRESGRVSVQVRGVPGIGYATRSFGASGGWTTLVDSDLHITVDQLFGRFGLALGYGFRYQAWRVGGPDAFDAAGSGKVTYDGNTQSLRVGITW